MAQLSTFAATASNVATNEATRTITISNEVVAIDGTLDPPTGSDDWGGWRIICTSSGGFRSVAGATGTLGGGTQSLTIIEESGGHRFGSDNFQTNTARFSGDQTNRLKYSNIIWIVNSGNRSDFDIYRGTNTNGSLGPSVELTGVWLQQQTASNQEAHFNHYSGNASIKIHSGVGFGLKISNFTNGPAIEFSTPIQSGAVVEGLVIDSVTATNNNTGSRCAVRLAPLPTNGTMTLSNLNTPSIAAVTGSATKNLLLIDPVGRPTRADWGNNYHGNFEIKRTVPFTFTGASVPATTTMHAVAQTSGGVNATATMSGTSGSIQVRTDYSANAASGGAWTTQRTYKFAMTALGIQKYSLTTTQTIANSPATITAAITADTLPNGSAISTITAPTDECDTVGEVLRVVKDWEVLNPTLSTAPDDSIVYVNGASVKFNDGYSVVLNASASELVSIASNVITIKCSNSTDLATSNGLTTLAATGSSKTITTPSVSGTTYTSTGVVGGLVILNAADNTAITSGDAISVTATGGWSGISVGTTYYLGKTGFPQGTGFLVGLYDTQAHAIAVGNTGLQSITGSGTNVVMQTPSSTPVTAADDVFFLDSSGQKSVISVLNNMGGAVLFSLINTSNGDTVADTGTTDVADDGTGTILVATKGLTTGYRLVGKRPGYRYFSVAVDLTGGGAFSFTAAEQEEIRLADGTGSYVGFLNTGSLIAVTDSSTGTTPGIYMGIKNSTITARYCFKASEDHLASVDGAKFMGLGGQQPTYSRDTLNGDQYYCGAHVKFGRDVAGSSNATVRASLFANDDQPINNTLGDIQTIEGINIETLGTELLVNQDFDADVSGTQSVIGTLNAIKTAVDSGTGGFTATDRTNLGSIKTTVEAVPTAAANATANWAASTRTLTSAAGLTATQATQLSNASTTATTIDGRLTDSNNGLAAIATAVDAIPTDSGGSGPTVIYSNQDTLVTPTTYNTSTGSFGFPSGRVSYRSRARFVNLGGYSGGFVLNRIYWAQGFYFTTTRSSSTAVKFTSYGTISDVRIDIPYPVSRNGTALNWNTEAWEVADKSTGYFKIDTGGTWWAYITGVDKLSIEARLQYQVADTSDGTYSAWADVPALNPNLTNGMVNWQILSSNQGGGDSFRQGVVSFSDIYPLSKLPSNVTNGKFVKFRLYLIRGSGFSGSDVTYIDNFSGGYLNLTIIPSLGVQIGGASSGGLNSVQATQLTNVSNAVTHATSGTAAIKTAVDGVPADVWGVDLSSAQTADSAGDLIKDAATNSGGGGGGGASVAQILAATIPASPTAGTLAAHLKTASEDSTSAKNDLANSTDGLGVLKSAIDTIDTNVDSIKADIENADHGLEALETDIGNISGGGGGFTATDRTNLGSVKTTVEALPSASDNATANWGATTRTLTTAAGLTSAQATQLSAVNTNAASIKTTVEALPSAADNATAIWSEEVLSPQYLQISPTGTAVNSVELPVSATNFTSLSAGTAVIMTNTGGYSTVTRNQTYYVWKSAPSLGRIALYTTQDEAINPASLPVQFTGGGTPTDIILTVPSRSVVRRNYGAASTIISNLIENTEELESMINSIPSAAQVTEDLLGTIIDESIVGDLEDVIPSAESGQGFQIDADEHALVHNGNRVRFTANGGYTQFTANTDYFVYKGTDRTIFIYDTSDNAIAGGAAGLIDVRTPSGTLASVRMTFTDARVIGDVAEVLREIHQMLYSPSYGNKSLYDLVGEIPNDVWSTDLDPALANTQDIRAAIRKINTLLGGSFVETDVSLQKAMRIVLSILAGRSSVSGTDTKTITYHRVGDDSAIVRGTASESGRTVPEIDP